VCVRFEEKQTRQTVVRSELSLESVKFMVFLVDEPGLEGFRRGVVVADFMDLGRWTGDPCFHPQTFQWAVLFRRLRDEKSRRRNVSVRGGDDSEHRERNQSPFFYFHRTAPVSRCFFISFRTSSASSGRFSAN